ncbi:MAG: glycogenin glucosyltransferase [Chaenotheca gracillima]|nr:MAG: glycogenin glucosyltransferase [Chaenotheca gracillima]
MASEKVPVWLDCDPGSTPINNSILYPFPYSVAETGITTVHGNASLECTTQNAGSILTAIGRPDVPVYPGCRKPFCRGPVHAPDIHGSSGLDGTTLLPEPTTPPILHKNGMLAMRDALLATPRHTAWLVITGTLTNAALMLSAFPEVSEWIKGVSIMGGAIGGGFSDAPISRMPGDEERVGNITRWAEFNIYCDPESASSLLSNPLLAGKITLIPLDLTHQCLATPEILTRLLPTSKTSAQTATGSGIFPAENLRPLLHDLLTFFAATYARVFGITAGPPLHDPLAVAAVLAEHPDPQHRIAFSTERTLSKDSKDASREWYVDVVTAGSHEDKSPENMVGRTVARPIDKASSIAATGSSDDAPGVRVMRSVDVPRFWTVVIDECLVRAEKAVRES